MFFVNYLGEIFMNKKKSVFIFLVVLVMQCIILNSSKYSIGGVPINNQWESYKFDGYLGEKNVLPPMTAFSAHVGGDDSERRTFVYEPPPGWIIYSFATSVVSQYGDSGYTPRLTSANAAFISEEILNEAFNNARSYAYQVKKDHYSAKIDELRNRSLEWNRKFASKNNHLEIECWISSQTVRGPFGVVIDTKTAELSLNVSITLARQLTGNEVEILKYKLYRLIDQDKDINSVFQ